MRAILTLLAAISLGTGGSPQAVVAQSAPGTAAVAGIWAGWVDVSGNFQPIVASFTPGNSPPGTITNLLTGTSRPLGALTIDGTRVRVEQADPRPPVLVGMLEGNRIDGKAEATGGRTGTFRLIRMAALDAAALHRFVGAYRF